MAQYNLSVKVVIREGINSDPIAVLMHYLTVPFVPYDDTSLTLRGTEVVLDKVTYDVDSDYFLCLTDCYVPNSYGSEDCLESNLQKHIRYYENAGFHLVGNKNA